MNQKNLKKSFSKIKEDMNFLNKKINLLHDKLEDSSKNRVNIEELNHIIDDLSIHSKENLEKIEKLEKSKVSSKVENKDLKILSEKIDELESKISKKNKTGKKTSDVSDDFQIQLDELKLEIENLKNNPNKNIETALNEFSEIFSEKIQLELSTLKMEVFDEISSIYNKCLEEIVNVKSDVEKNSKKILKEKSPTKKSSKIKKESKIKKAAKWFLVDEEDEDDISSIKNEVKKSSK